MLMAGWDTIVRKLPFSLCWSLNPFLFHFQFCLILAISISASGHVLRSTADQDEFQLLVRAKEDNFLAAHVRTKRYLSVMHAFLAKILREQQQQQQQQQQQDHGEVTNKVDNYPDSKANKDKKADTDKSIVESPEEENSLTEGKGDEIEPDSEPIVNNIDAEPEGSDDETADPETDETENRSAEESETESEPDEDSETGPTKPDEESGFMDKDDESQGGAEESESDHLANGEEAETETMMTTEDSVTTIVSKDGQEEADSEGFQDSSTEKTIVEDIEMEIGIKDLEEILEEEGMEITAGEQKYRENSWKNLTLNCYIFLIFRVASNFAGSKLPCQMSCQMHGLQMNAA